MRRLAIALFALLAPLVSGCMSSFVLQHARGPLPPRFDDVAATEAWLDGDDLLLALSGDFERPARLRRRYWPSSEKETAWLVVHPSALLGGLPNVVPRADLHDGPLPEAAHADARPVRVIDLRPLSVATRDASLRRFSNEYDRALFLYSRPDEYKAAPNFFCIYAVRRPELRRVDVFRIELEPAETRPQPLYYALLPFAVVGDIVFGIPYLLLVAITENSIIGVTIAA